MFCFYHQWKIGQHISAQEALPQSLRRHVDACAGCRAHHDDQRRVARLLADVSATIPEPPPYLRERIMRAVAADAADDADDQRSWALPAFARPAMALALVMLVSWNFWPRPDTTTPIHSHPQPVAVAQSTPPTLPSLPAMPVESTLSLLGTSIATPYAAEWTGLKQDLASAGAFLGDRLPKLPPLVSSP